MELNIDEALRYLGIRGTPDPALREEAAALAQELTARHAPRWVYRVLPLHRTMDSLRLGDGEICLPGQSAARMLAECDTCAVLCCTLGSACEAWLRREQQRDMRRAVILDALCSALVESGCDEAESELHMRFPTLHLTDRFSPGYGDLPLTVQTSLLTVTDAARRLGVLETPTHMMTPQKSVTALIGLSDRPQAARIRGCAFCAMNRTCPLRKAGTPCEI